MQVARGLLYCAVLYLFIIFGLDTASFCSNDVRDKTFFKNLEYQLEICDPIEDVVTSVGVCAVLCMQKNCTAFSMAIPGECRVCLPENAMEITADAANELWLIRNVMVTNPVKRNHIPTPGGLPVGTTVIITGTPTSNERFDVSRNDTNRVFLSHRINGSWYSPASTIPFLLKVNVKFKLIVLFTKVDMKAYVNDIYCCSKDYYFNATDITYITYDEAVELHELSF